MSAAAFAAHWREVVRGFLKIGALSYGGPAIMGLMQTEFQEKRAWLSKERFLEGLALVNMLPGPGATQLGIYIGYVRAGWWGGALAGLCFIVPAFVIMLALAALYAEYGALPATKDVFYGLGPVVVGIFAVAVYRLGRNAVGDAWQGGLTLGAAFLRRFRHLELSPRCCWPARWAWRSTEIAARVSRLPWWCWPWRDSRVGPAARSTHRPWCWRPKAKPD
jgi:chromate transport protein ChrA